MTLHLLLIIILLSKLISPLYPPIFQYFYIPTPLLHCISSKLFLSLLPTSLYTSISLPPSPLLLTTPPLPFLSFSSLLYLTLSKTLWWSNRSWTFFSLAFTKSKLSWSRRLCIWSSPRSHSMLTNSKKRSNVVEKNHKDWK